MSSQTNTEQLDALRERIAELEERYAASRREADEERRLRTEQQAAFQQQHAFVKLLQSVAVAANEAPSVVSALRITLDQVCAHTGWPVGHACLVDRTQRRRLVPSGPWHLDHPDRYRAFREATERASFEWGRGLPGLVLQREEPVWLVNVASDARFVRAAAASACALNVGFAFPVLVRDEVVAVLEFFYHELVPPNEDLLEVARHVGTQLGRVIERRHAEDALRITRMQQQALSRRLLEIQELERSRIARELHDQIGQVLTAVKLNLEATQHAHADQLQPADVAESLAAIDHAIEQVRTLSFELRPALLDDLGLAVAVGSYAKRQAKKARLDLHLNVASIDSPIRKEVETACFRILQEALTNVLRHAQAHRVEVNLSEGDGVLELAVRDDGIGFAAESQDHPRSGYGRLGLLGMRERAQNVGGVFQVESQPTKGTLIRARLPLRASDRLERRGSARS